MSEHKKNQLNTIIQQHKELQDKIMPPRLREFVQQQRELQDKVMPPRLRELMRQKRELLEKIQALKESQREVENNQWHLMTCNELEREKEKSKQQQIEIEQLEAKLTNVLATIELKQNSSTACKKQYSKIQNLSPNITTQQIKSLSVCLTSVFDATIEQWEALFSENSITMPTPIKANSIADISVLFYYLKQKEFIETSKYPSILERSKAFFVKNKTITAKQINKTKEYSNFPYIGDNYEKIMVFIENL